MKAGARRAGNLTVTPIAGGWAVSGEIDANSAPDLSDALTADRTDVDGSALTLDLADVDFIDSSGLAVLVDARREAEARGVMIALRRPSASVRRLLAITRLDEAFGVEQLPTPTARDARATRAT